MQATDLTVIVGDNDCGKSNVLRALNLFFNGETNPSVPFNFLDDYNRYVEPRKKKAAEIEVELHLEIPESYREHNGDLICWRKRWREDGLQDAKEYYGVRIAKRKRGQGFNETKIELPGRSRVPSLLNRIQFEYVPAVRSAEFFRALRGRIFHVIAKASEQSVRASSGQLESVISDAVSGLLDDINKEISDKSTLRLPNDLTPIFENLDFLNGEKSISLDNRGDGIKARYIPLILKFIAEKSRGFGGIAPTFIWAYEEPENNLDFRRGQALASTFKKLAQDEFSQVLLTTHSPVFYNMHNQDGGKGVCTAFHLTNEGPGTGTKARSAFEATVSLDESMGAMAIIAPHMRAAEDALAEASDHAADLRAKLQEFNGAGLPTIFLEGATEYIIFKSLLEQSRPQHLGKLFFAEPPARAGANYVANMLRSWEYRSKHLALERRAKAVGIVDADGEGLSAARRFEEEGASWKHVSLLTLSTPDHLLPAAALGIEIPVTLEELWPCEIWRQAHDRNWLVDRPKKGLIGGKLTQRLVEENARLTDFLSDSWRIYFEKCADSDVEHHAKSKWANYMANLPTPELEVCASEHLKILDRAIAKLGLG